VNVTRYAFANESDDRKIAMHLFVSTVDSARDQLNSKNLLGEKGKIPGALSLSAGVAVHIRNKNRALSQ
jgi:hypothetical protein